MQLSYCIVIPRSSSSSPVLRSRFRILRAVGDLVLHHRRIGVDQRGLRLQNEEDLAGAQLVLLLLRVQILLREILRDLGQPDAVLRGFGLADGVEHIQADLLLRAPRGQRVRSLADDLVGIIRRSRAVADRQIERQPEGVNRISESEHLAECVAEAAGDGRDAGCPSYS